jgi:AcrR family transcriptional regulator
MARRNDHTREEIRCMALTAAEALAATGGYKNISARRIAAAIGYTVGTLYLIFENLDDIILQVNGRTLDQLYDWLDARRGGDASPHAALRALSLAYIAYAKEQSPRWNMLLDHAEGKSGALPGWYQRKLGKVFGLVETALHPLAGDEAEVQRVARVLWASVHGICTLKIRQRMELAGGQSAEEMAQTLIENFLRGYGLDGPCH